MERVTVRPGTRDDIPSVLALWERARSPHARSVDDERLIRQLLDRDPDALLVAEVSGRVVGTLVAGWDGWRERDEQVGRFFKNL
jgi:ribosomal protein S18 acetylase RimI-like enzyme